MFSCPTFDHRKYYGLISLRGTKNPSNIYTQTPTSQITKHSLLRNRQIYGTAVAIMIINISLQKMNTGTDSVLKTIIPTGTTIALYASLWGHDASHFGVQRGAAAAPLQCESCPWSSELLLSNRTSDLGRDTHGDRHVRRKWRL